MRVVKLVMKQLIICSFNGMGFIGLALIADGTYTLITNNKLPGVDYIAPWASLILTLLGTIFTAISIYFPSNTRNSDSHSKYVTAPVTNIMVLLAFGYVVLNQKLLPDRIVNGFAILGLSGALFRLLSYSEWEHEENKVVAYSNNNNKRIRR